MGTYPVYGKDITISAYGSLWNDQNNPYTLYGEISSRGNKEVRIAVGISGYVKLADRTVPFDTLPADKERYDKVSPSGGAISTSQWINDDFIVRLPELKGKAWLYAVDYVGSGYSKYVERAWNFG